MKYRIRSYITNNYVSVFLTSLTKFTIQHNISIYKYLKMEDALTSVDDLERKLNSARQSLIGLNDNIRRFVGRGLKDSRFLLISLKQKKTYIIVFFQSGEIQS